MLQCLPGQGGKVRVDGNVYWVLEDVGCFVCLVKLRTVLSGE